MNPTSTVIKTLLLPFSLLYGLVVWVRNSLFDMGILRTYKAHIPVISIGNITVGGTGKTPMTEYLAGLLGSTHQVAILSRGYKRKSKGFVVGSSTTGTDDLGDEPTQMQRKFPHTVVAVDKNRRRGIEMLIGTDRTPPIDVILLDDAYQHRYVTPGLNLLLVDYNRPIYSDTLLPSGNLREPAAQHKRADIILFTKCPDTITPIERRIICMEAHPFPYQSIYFTKLAYGPLRAVHKNNTDNESALSMEEIADKQLPVLIVAGIAFPDPFITYVKTYCFGADILTFPDHHRFNQQDIEKINKSFEALQGKQGVILTTEKDAVRIMEDSRFDSLLDYIYFPTLNIRFLDNSEEDFNNKILNYVQRNKRNS